ncbi:MAG: DUF1653 domain-containing protein [Pyrinomonadaceae bacterium]
MQDRLPCGVYEHYKGRRYLVLGVARHSETGADLVVYVPLYEHSGPPLWVRPLEMFTEEVDDGEDGRRPRFRYAE